MSRFRAQQGSSLIAVLSAVTLMGVFAASALAFVGSGTVSSSVALARVERVYAADAAVEYALVALRDDVDICSDSGESHTWPSVDTNGRSATPSCDWVGGTPGNRIVRLAATVDAIEGERLPTTVVATVEAETSSIQSWSVEGEWTSPGPSTTTTTAPSPTTTTTAPPTTTTSTTVPSSTTTTTVPSSTTTTTISTLNGSIYLKTSGPGDRASSTPLPLTAAAPTASVLPNYDTDRDAVAGLLIRKGASGASETDPTKQQAWTMAIAGRTRIDGDVELVLWSSLKNFTNKERGSVTAHLQDCNASGGECTTLSETVARSKWATGGKSWVSSTFDFGNVQRELQGGRILRLIVTVDSTSHDDMWFAYDTTGQPSRLVLK